MPHVHAHTHKYTRVHESSLVCPQLTVSYPSPDQGDFTTDPPVAFVDIPRDEACGPDTCIQVVVLPCPAPHTSVPSPSETGSSGLPRAAPAPGLALGPFSPAAPPGRPSGRLGRGTGKSRRPGHTDPVGPVCRAGGPTCTSPPPSSCVTSSAVSTRAGPQPEGCRQGTLRAAGGPELAQPLL